MITLKIGVISYHFMSVDTMRCRGKRPAAPAGFQSYTPWFGTLLMAQTYLKKFTGNRAMAAQVVKLFVQLGRPLWSNPSPSNWTGELAPLLHSGDVVVIEMKPKPRDVATKSKKVEVALPVPRKGPVAEKPAPVEQATFPPLNEDAQAQALAIAAQAGAPFCEVCSRT